MPELDVFQIAEHNDEESNGRATFRKGLNEFTDLTFTEFERTYLSAVTPSIPARDQRRYYGNPTHEFDWRQR